MSGTEKPPYRCSFGDVANMNEEKKFDITTIVVNTSWEIKLDVVMVNNSNEYCCKKSASESKELGKGVLVGV